MAVDYKRHEINTITVTNIQYTTTLSCSSFGGHLEPFLMGGSPFSSNIAKDGMGQFCASSLSSSNLPVCGGSFTSEIPIDTDNTSLLHFLDEKAKDSYVNDEELKGVFGELKSAALSTTISEVSVMSKDSGVERGCQKWATKSCDIVDWRVPEGGSLQRDSYVNDEELNEVFAQLKSAALSTSNSEGSFISRERGCQKWAVKSCDTVDWRVLEGGSSQRDSYVNDEELKEVFSELKSAALSSSNSEASFISRERGCQKWDTQNWKKYYESNRSRPSGIVVTSDSSPSKENSEITGEKKEKIKSFFKSFQFSPVTLERIRTPGRKKRRSSARVDGKQSRKQLPSSLKSSTIVKDRKKNIYTDHDSLLYQHLSDKEIAEYRKCQELKARFAPSFISRRTTNKLRHTDIFKEMNPAAFEELECKFEPHEVFPAFGEGKYTTTAVSKNYTFSSDQQMKINQENYFLDQKVKELKTRKRAEQQPPFKIHLNQTSSYINRMKEYERIHEENQKIARLFDPSQIRTTSEVYQGMSKTSLSSKTNSAKSATSFSSRMYTKSYNKKTVKKLTHSRNQYAKKSPSKVPKKYKRPEWDAGHVDYKKTEVKPIQYKSIRKLPVTTLSNSSSTLTPKASASFVLKPSNDYASTSSSICGKTCKTKSCLTISQRPKNNNGRCDLTKPECQSESVTKIVQQNKSSFKNSVTTLTNSDVNKTERIHSKSRIPLRKAENSTFDLNNEKFQVFRSWNNTLFGTDGKEGTNVGSKYEIKLGGIQNRVEGKVDENKNGNTKGKVEGIPMTDEGAQKRIVGGTKGRNTIRECRESRDKNNERGAGDATNVMTENNERCEHQTDEKTFEKQSLSPDKAFERESLPDEDFAERSIDKAFCKQRSIHKCIDKFANQSVDEAFAKQLSIDKAYLEKAVEEQALALSSDTGIGHGDSEEDETLSDTSNISLHDLDSPRSKETREEFPVRSVSCGSIFESGFSNSLDIISERTEPVSDIEETKSEVENCLELCGSNRLRESSDDEEVRTSESSSENMCPKVCPENQTCENTLEYYPNNHTYEIGPPEEAIICSTVKPKSLSYEIPNAPKSSYVKSQHFDFSQKRHDMADFDLVRLKVANKLNRLGGTPMTYIPNGVSVDGRSSGDL